MPESLKTLAARSRSGLISALILSFCAGCASTPPGGGAGAAPPPPTSAQAGTQTIVAIAPPAAPQQNLLDFLGITAIGKCIGQGFTALMGMLPNIFPGMNNGLAEMMNQPPVLAVNDPANLKSSNPAVQAAAAAMQDEDAAPQKIAALEFFAKHGCTSCYPEIEKAMLASLDDCVESVRFAAATAIYEAAGHPCKFCNPGTCCSPAIRERLMEIGYKLSEKTGCPMEPSARVRRVARLALLACGPDCNPPPAATTPILPAEGPDQAV
ncbi:MAG TPA: hypothetical protein VKU82_14365, partial [Planctomycetaceae bacterium]|nr:hypothetical protein [Planctomycetaceae bacterium]